MARIMLAPPGPMVRHFNIPKEVVREAYKDNAEAKREMANSVAKIRDLMAELDAISPVGKLLWRAFGIWDEPKRRRAVGTAKAA